MQKYNISVVSYLNSTPFIYGFENFEPIKKYLRLSLDYPAECAKKLKSGKVDIGLIPVAELPNVRQANIISNYCIGAEGAVKTVLLVSDVPFNEITRVYLDYQSRSSVTLLRILSSYFENKSFEYLKATPGYEKKIAGKTAGVIIGDRTFALPREFPYVYDLSEEWHRHTNMPFTFAVWTANKKIVPEFIELFNEACALGLNNIDLVVETYKKNNFTNTARLSEYLKNDISYIFDNSKREAMEYFLMLKEKIKLS